MKEKREREREKQKNELTSSKSHSAMLLIKRRNASSHISFSRVTQSVSRVPAYASKETHKQNGFHQPNEVPAIEWD
jgi:hypothetical protein